MHSISNLLLFLGSNTLPRSKPKPPLSPIYKPNGQPPQVFAPKESTSPLPSYYPSSAPSYNAQNSYTPQPNYEPEPLLQTSQTPPQPPVRVNFNNLQNYNTSARGWGQNKSFYKPITFEKAKSPFTDF